jgi:predicted nicotinamide N-methyase
MDDRSLNCQTQEYVIPIAGRTLRLLGPRFPHSLNTDPRFQNRADDDEYKPFWALPTSPAVMLAEHVIREMPPGMEPVLELGAGLGIASLALAMAGYPVVATDYDADALAFVQASAKLNGVELLAVRQLDWRKPPSEQYGVIVGAEVAYERRSHPALAALLTQCLAPAGRAFISDLNRTTADAFPEALAAAGLAFDTVRAQARAIPSFDSIDGRVFKGRIFRIWKTRPQASPPNAE